MGDRVDLVLIDQPRDQARVARVADDQPGAVGHGPVEPGRKIVEDDDRLAGVQEPKRHMAADISGPAGHQNAHVLPFSPSVARARQTPRGLAAPDLLNVSPICFNLILLPKE